MDDRERGALPPYRGSDRRGLARASGLDSRQVATWVSGAGTGMVGLALALVTLAPQALTSLWPLALALWCAATLAAGLMLLGAWRLGGRSMPARLGCALVVTAVMVALVPVVAGAFVGVDGQMSARAIALGCVLAVTGAWMARAVRGDQVETDLHPARALALVMALSMVGTAAALGVVAVAPAGSMPWAGFVPCAVCVVVGVWLMLVGRRRGTTFPGDLLAAAMLLLGVAAAARLQSTSVPALLVSVVALAVTGGLFGAVAHGSLRVALDLHRVRSLGPLAALAEYEVQAGRERERRHDALSALAAIRSASEVLTSSGPDLAPSLRGDLAEAVRAELSRVERMLAPDTTAQAVDVDLPQLLAPMLLSWRQRGLEVEDVPESPRVYAAPDVVARIVNNLLHNAHCHAPNASVQLAVDETDDAIHLSVVDAGPGIPRERRADVFAPGVSLSPGDEGQGLGLASAQRLAQEQGGGLQLLDVDGGCWFVLTLPRGRLVDRAPENPDRREHAG